MIRSFRRKPQGCRRKRNERSAFRRRWPVGQEVKTGASHAPNVGSIPARVTIFLFGGAQNPLQIHTNVLYYFGRQKEEKRAKPFTLFSSFWEVSRCQ